ncbi:uncharacterized protein LOC111879190 [Lactuca sativa]|uniref:uncharacterized protein LOC111879190 n=1 Tax=Lactuca sativa TaxID=4236 RepID=UPI000CD92C59|nr:uncharacterized protein LOC111879190 [Lactuca sativa]
MAKRSKSPTPPSSENDEEDDEDEIHHESPRVSVSVAPVHPPTTSQTTTSLSPPSLVTSFPISTTPLPPPIISQSTTTTIPEPTVEVNVSETGATTGTEPPVTSKALSPTHSTDSGATLSGANDEFDSTYYSPYRLPTDEDDDAPITRQHLQPINEKLDKLLDNNKSASGTVNDSSSACKKAIVDVADIVHTTQIFLNSLKGHTDTNAAKEENTSLLRSVYSQLESLQADLANKSTLKEELTRQASTIEVQKVQLSQAEKEISLLKTERVVLGAVQRMSRIC